MSSSIQWDPLMIQRYDQAGPRYTSYPTAMELNPRVDHALEQRLLKTPGEKPLSLYIHIPFCRELCYYCGCNKIVTHSNERAATYVANLYREIQLKAAMLAHEGTATPKVVEQIHLGGGTPTFLSDAQLYDLMTTLRRHFRLSELSTRDFSIEIDPRSLRENTLKVLREAGFNRLSFGIQDMDIRVQTAINRIQPASLIEKVMRESGQLGFRSINLDLIYGLPYQTLDSFAATLRQTIALRPERVSVFNYAHLPERFRSQRRIDPRSLPDAQEKLALIGLAIHQLTEAGYDYIGMDHFALPEDALSQAQKRGRLHRNFQGYTTHGDCDLIGFGVSSISQIDNAIFQNTTDIRLWQSAIMCGDLATARQCVATGDDQLRREVIMGLLCHQNIAFEDLDRKFQIDSRLYFRSELESLLPMARDGLVDISAEKITITETGRVLARQICMVFDKYRNQAKSSTAAFSRAI
ncbi:MAG: oxygen-independent coproporphyrinogen III oxidase [Thalassolituus sp.]|nr:MAG: oxygen-independent coproporphyrinogen III oxidase [Thalassolituus sp.]